MKKAEYEVVGSWGLETRVYFDFFFFLATPQGLWDLSSPTGDRTRAPCSGSAES